MSVGYTTGAILGYKIYIQNVVAIADRNEEYCTCRSLEMAE